jgi:hypothetical protein
MTKTLKVEKGVPLPPPVWRKSRIYPFDSMKVGDSFFVPGGDRQSYSKAISAAHYYGKKHDMKFRIRGVEGGCRVWRIE